VGAFGTWTCSCVRSLESLVEVEVEGPDPPSPKDRREVSIVGTLSGAGTETGSVCVAIVWVCFATGFGVGATGGGVGGMESKMRSSWILLPLSSSSSSCTESASMSLSRTSVITFTNLFRRVS
jgi:hypothetical protein